MTIVVHRTGRLVGAMLLGATVGWIASRVLPTWAAILFMVALLVWLVVLLRRLQRLHRELRVAYEELAQSARRLRSLPPTS